MFSHIRTASASVSQIKGEILECWIFLTYKPVIKEKGNHWLNKATKTIFTPNRTEYNARHTRTRKLLSVICQHADPVIYRCINSAFGFTSKTTVPLSRLHQHIYSCANIEKHAFAY